MGSQMSWVKSTSGVALIAVCSSMAIWAGQPGRAQDLESILAAAGEAQGKGNFSAAAGYYRQAVKMSPDTAELWANLGLMDDLAGNSLEALKNFSQAAHLNASMYVPQLFLGIENLKLNRAETAIPFLQRAQQMNPNDPQAPLALGRAFALSGKGDRASDAYGKATDLTPNDGNAWLGLGMAELQQSSADDRMMSGTYKESVYTRLRAGERYAEQGKLNRASDAYASALTVQSPLPLCSHAAYGIVLMRLQDVTKAESEFNQELKLNPGCGLAKLGLAGVRLMQGDTEGALKDLELLWQTDRGFLEESLPLLRDGLSEDKRDQLLHMAESLANGNVPDADSEQAASSDASNNAEAFYLSGQYQKCSDSLLTRLNALPEPSLLLLTSCAFYSGDYKTASLAARRLKSIAASPLSGLYWESKADQKIAVAALARAGETGSNSPQLHVLLGDIYRQKEQWEDAENEYRKTLALDPKDQSASLGLAMALFADGKSEEALAIDKALLKAAPDDAKENLLVGEILVRSGHFTDAEIYLKKIHDTGQTLMPRVHILLGQVYLATDRLPQALSEFKLNLSNDDDGTIHYQIGRIYQRLGDKERAEEAFRVAKQLREQSYNGADFAPQ